MPKSHIVAALLGALAVSHVEQDPDVGTANFSRILKLRRLTTNQALALGHHANTLINHEFRLARVTILSLFANSEPAVAARVARDQLSQAFERAEDMRDNLLPAIPDSFPRSDEEAFRNGYREQLDELARLRFNALRQDTEDTLRELGEHELADTLPPKKDPPPK